MKTLRQDDLTAAQLELVTAAEELLPRAYAPYSGFSVAAAWRSVEGSIFAATNYESASYGLSMCAERAAIYRANAEGARHSLTAVAVIARSASGLANDVPVTPCGACRQLIHEVACLNNRIIEVLCCSSDCEHFILTDSQELLPFGFGPESLRL